MPSDPRDAGRPADRPAGATGDGAGDGLVCPICGSTDLDLHGPADERRAAGSSEAIQCNSCGRLFVPSGGRRNF